MDSFLPDTYTPPASNSSYMKFKDWENTFRILSSPVLGWEYWQDKKPVRLTYTEDNGRVASKEAAKNPDPLSNKAKHFWAMVVWNYSTNKIEILQINQRAIQESIRGYIAKKSWGNPKLYDIVVDKSGTGTDTKYAVSPIPPSPIESDIEKEFKNTPVNLQALFYGADPFDIEWKEPVDEAFVADTF